MKLPLVVERYVQTLLHGVQLDQELVQKPVHSDRSPQLGQKVRAVDDKYSPY